MSTAAEVLVIILSIFLAVFLVLAVTLSIYLIKLTRDIRGITQSAGRTVNNLESAVSRATKFTPPIYIIEQISKYIRKYMKSNDKKNKNKGE